MEAKSQNVVHRGPTMNALPQTNNSRAHVNTPVMLDDPGMSGCRHIGTNLRESLASGGTGNCVRFYRRFIPTSFDYVKSRRICTGILLTRHRALAEGWRNDAKVAVHCPIRLQDLGEAAGDPVFSLSVK
eukprot:scaffold41822_cov58-Attheya_sp.AAC.3